MKKKSFTKGKKAAGQIMEVLQREFPKPSDIDGIMCALEITVAATLAGVFGMGEDDVDLFAEHVKYFVRQKGLPDESDTHSANKK